MINNDNFEEQLRRLIAETKDELNKIDIQINKLAVQKIPLSEELESYRSSLSSYLKRVGKQVEEEKPIDWDKLFKRVKTHKQRLLIIARYNNGELKINKAVDILYKGKYIKSKNKHNAYVQIYQIVMEMVDKKLFEKTDPGTFKLIGAQQSFIQ